MLYRVCVLALCLGQLPLQATTMLQQVPPYVQSQVDGLNMQIKELEIQREQLQKQLMILSQQASTPDTEMAKQQINAQIDLINEQITNLENQKKALLQGYGK